MQGRKPKLKNVIPMRPETAGNAAETAALRDKAIRRAVALYRPKGIGGELLKEWNRVAGLLADPLVDRLKPRYADVIVEYCRVLLRLRKLRASFEEIARQTAKTDNPVSALGAEIHETAGRNGMQLKSHPHVAQMNETWRQWRSLVAMLGLSPTDERNLLPGQGDLFDESEKYYS